MPKEAQDSEANLRAKTEAEQLFALPIQSGGLRDGKTFADAEPVSAALIALFALLGFGLAWFKRGKSRKDAEDSVHTNPAEREEAEG